MGQEYAYITGAASGLGFLIAKFLVSKGIKVFIADIDGHSVEAAGKELNVPFGTVNVACWESQVKTFEEAVAQFGRIDYVYPIAGIGERTWIPSAAGGDGRGFARPDMSIIDVNVNGLMFTVALALQQFRRQSLGEHGLKGKILCASSVCGIYCCSTLPIYTASKHAVTGLVRSYGKQLPKENITLNAFLPNVMRTNFSTNDFYETLQAEGLLTPTDGVLEVTALLLGDSRISGECFEIGPNYAKGQGLVKPNFTIFVDEESRRVFDKLELRENPK